MATGINRPAAKAASRAGGAALGLGLLGLASAALVLARLIETWRVSPHASSHHVTILGQRLDYPAANVGAIVVLALALPALVATVLAIGHAAHEGLKAAKLRAALRKCRTGTIGDAIVIADERPLAFCAGLLRPRIYISTQALTLLDERALDAVLAHERHHARRRDPLRLAAARVLARSLLFVPALKRLEQQQASLAELVADEAAVAAAPGSRAALARAVLTFADAPGGAAIETERIDQLIGSAPSWTFPTLVCLLGGAVLALAVAVALLAGRVASGSATLAPPFLSRQPCVLVLAALTAGVAIVATYPIRTRLHAHQAA